MIPTTGNISLADVRNELRLVNVGRPQIISLGDADVRALAGIPSGPISLGSLRGKSSYTPMTVSSFNGSNAADTISGAGAATCYPSVSVAGGSGGFTYLWAFTSNPGGSTLGNATSATCSVSHAYAQNEAGSAAATLQCTVSDNTGHSVTKTGISAALSWYTTYTPMTVSSANGSSAGDSTTAGGSVTCNPSVSVVNGSGGYTYQWSFTYNPFACVLSSSTGATCAVTTTYGLNANGSASATLQCAVTDSTGHVVTKTSITAALSWSSTYTPMTVTGVDGYGQYDSSAVAGTATCSPYVSVTGGSGGYTYAWSFTSNPNTCTLSGSTVAGCSVSRAYSRNSNGSASAVLQCVVTDNTGHTVTQTGINSLLEWSNNA
jgi:hypothetical protein